MADQKSTRTPQRHRPAAGSDRAGAARPAPTPPMRCCSKASRCRMPAASARPRSSNARKARISGCGCFIGRQQAIVSSSDRSPKTLAELVERAVAMARTVPEDPYLRHRRPCRDRPRLAEPRHARPRGAERRDPDRAGARRRGGGARGRGRHQFRRRRGRLGPLAASRSPPRTALPAAIAGSSHGVSAQRDRRRRAPAWSATTISRARSTPPICATRPRSARAPASARSSGSAPRKMPTCRCPVVFDPRVARSFISHLLGAISGPSIARGTSFLKDRLGAADLSRGDHDHRRPAPPARPALEAVRRRGHRQPPPRDHRQGRADDLAPRSALGAPARPEDDRPRRARHRLAALAGRDQCVDRARGR